MVPKENLKLAAVAVFCLLMAWTGPSIAHGVHAKFAHNADKVDGKHAVGAGASTASARGKLVAHDATGRLAGKFLPTTVVTEAEYTGRAATIVTSHPGSGAFLSATTTGEVTTFGARATSSSGRILLPVSAPATVGGTVYGLSSITFCAQMVNGGYVNQVLVDATEGAEIFRLALDGTDRHTSGCFDLAVGKRVRQGVTIDVATFAPASGSVALTGVRATWSRTATGVGVPTRGR